MLSLYKIREEISGMKMFKTTRIDGYTGAKLCGFKDHVGVKPHGKAMRSFEATVLKLPSENDQREFETSITPEEISCLTRKAKITYFIAKNGTALKKFIDLINLVHKKGNLNFEKDIGNLYVNKQGCGECIEAHDDVSIEKLAQDISNSSFFSIWMVRRSMERERSSLCTIISKG